MTYEEALAHARRLLSPEAYAAIVRGPRPAGGHVLAALAPAIDPEAQRAVDAAVNARSGTAREPLTRPRVAVEEQRTSGAGDPRAEREVAAVVSSAFPATAALRRHNDEREREDG